MVDHSNPFLFFNSIDPIVFILLHFTTRCSFAYYHSIDMKISLHTYNSFSYSCFGPSCRACHFVHIFFIISSVHDGLFSLRSSSLAPPCFFTTRSHPNFFLWMQLHWHRPSSSQILTSYASISATWLSE